MFAIYISCQVSFHNSFFHSWSPSINSTLLDTIPRHYVCISRYCHFCVWNICLHFLALYSSLNDAANLMQRCSLCGYSFIKYSSWLMEVFCELLVSELWHMSWPRSLQKFAVQNLLGGTAVTYSCRMSSSYLNLLLLGIAITDGSSSSNSRTIYWNLQKIMNKKFPNQPSEKKMFLQTY